MLEVELSLYSKRDNLVKMFKFFFIVLILGRILERFFIFSIFENEV